MYSKMNHKGKSLFIFMLLALLLALGSGIQASQANPARSNSADEVDRVRTPRNLVVNDVVSPADQEAALAFWTREAIAAAQPMELLVHTGPIDQTQSRLEEFELIGEPGFVMAGMSAPDADIVAQMAYPEDWAALEEIAVGDAVLFDEPAGIDQIDGSSQIYTSYVVNQASALQKMYPHRWIGRFSFRTPSGTSYCSAASISNNVMLTAAHCLYDTTNNRWYTNRVFTPAYRNGNAPYGTFAATECFVLTAWVNLTGSYSINGWARHDVGVCKTGKNSAGKTLNEAVGWMGRQWNQPYTRHFHNLGYPFRNTSDALLTNSGRYLRLCAAESFRRTTETLGMGCNYGRGISGGPWMVNYAPGVVSGNANSVNSGIVIGTRNIYGARFNSNNIVPLCNAAGC
jgi:hypothetical protein